MAEQLNKILPAKLKRQVDSSAEKFSKPRSYTFIGLFFLRAHVHPLKD